MTKLDANALLTWIEKFWEGNAESVFEDYVRIPCVNLNYTVGEHPGTPPESTPPQLSGDCYWPRKYADKTWAEAMTDAANLVQGWVRLMLKDLEPKILFERRVAATDKSKSTPIILVHIPGQAPGSVLTYGHLDKQTITREQWTPPAQGPFCPVVSNGKLYGRGTADDGYSTFFLVAIIAAMKANDIPYPTFNLLIDCDEESGSETMSTFLAEARVKALIGKPDLCVALDSGAGDYERLWFTVSERGTITGPLKVQNLKTGVHSGDGGGIIPSCTRIIRELLERVEDVQTGAICPDFLKAPIPDDQERYIEQQAKQLGQGVYTLFPWLEPAGPLDTNPIDLVRAKAWEPALTITGVDGLPTTDAAGNVIVPSVTFELSLRVPPSIDVMAAREQLGALLTESSPLLAGATVTFDYKGHDSPIGQGWFASPPPWLEDVFNSASKTLFGQDAQPISDGGTVPILATLQRLYPSTQFLASGVAGPGNNEHAANENLDIMYAQKLAVALVSVFAAVPENASKPELVGKSS